jgi:hypothetical protein
LLVYLQYTYYPAGASLLGAIIGQIWFVVMCTTQEIVVFSIALHQPRCTDQLRSRPRNAGPSDFPPLRIFPSGNIDQIECCNPLVAAATSARWMPWRIPTSVATSGPSMLRRGRLWTICCRLGRGRLGTRRSMCTWIRKLWEIVPDVGDRV